MSNRKSKFRAVRKLLGGLLMDEIDAVVVSTPEWSDEPLYTPITYVDRKQKPNNGLERFFFDDVVVNERTVPFQNYFLWRMMMKELPYLYTKAEVVEMRNDWIRACGFEEWVESLEESV